MKTVKNKKDLEAIVQKEVEKLVDKLFYKLHKKAKTKSGDIDPLQMEELEEITTGLTTLKIRLTRLAEQQVWQNIATDANVPAND
ncbi:MAG: hypothetical protein QM640_06350 [Niabella sp.]